MLKSFMDLLPRRETRVGELEELITVLQTRQRAVVRRQKKMVCEDLILVESKRVSFSILEEKEW